MATTLFGWRPSALTAACLPTTARQLGAVQVYGLGRSTVSGFVAGAVDGGAIRGFAAAGAASYKAALPVLATSPATAGRGVALEPLPLVKPGKANGLQLDNSISTSPIADATTGATTSDLFGNTGNGAQQRLHVAIRFSKLDMVKGGGSRGIPPRGRRKV